MAHLGEFGHATVVEVREALFVNVLGPVYRERGGASAKVKLKRKIMMDGMLYLPVLDLWVTSPAVDVDFDTAALDTVTEQLVGKVVSAVENNEAIRACSGSDACLELVKQLEPKVRRGCVSAVNVANARSEEGYVELSEEAFGLLRLGERAL